MPRAALAPEQLRTFTGVAGELAHPVDLLGHAHFTASLERSSIRVARTDDPSSPIPFAGTAILFNKRTWIGARDYGFWEQIAPQSVTKTLLEADVRFLQNHNPDLVLARTNPTMRAAGNPTLTLTPAADGLKTDADMAPVSYARDLAVLLERGDVSQMSFAFDPIAWIRTDLADGSTLITITELQLYDVSVVTYPAYVDTDAGLRAAAFDAICRSSSLDPAHVVRVFMSGETMPNVTRDTLAPPPAPERLKRARLVTPLTRSLNGWTLSDLWPILDNAVVELLSTPDFNAYWYCWLVDVSDEWFVYCDDRPGATFPTFMQVTYTIDADGTVMLGEPVEVVLKTTYVPVNEAGPEDEPGMGDAPVEDATEMSTAPASATRSNSAPASATRDDTSPPAETTGKAEQRRRRLREQRLSLPEEI